MNKCGDEMFGRPPVGCWWSGVGGRIGADPGGSADWSAEKGSSRCAQRRIGVCNLFFPTWRRPSAPHVEARVTAPRIACAERAGALAQPRGSPLRADIILRLRDFRSRLSNTVVERRGLPYRICGGGFEGLQRHRSGERRDRRGHYDRVDTKLRALTCQRRDRQVVDPERQAKEQVAASLRGAKRTPRLLSAGARTRAATVTKIGANADARDDGATTFLKACVHTILRLLGRAGGAHAHRVSERAHLRSHWHFFFKINSENARSKKKLSRLQRRSAPASGGVGVGEAGARRVGVGERQGPLLPRGRRDQARRPGGSGRAPLRAPHAARCGAAALRRQRGVGVSCG